MMVVMEYKTAEKKAFVQVAWMAVKLDVLEMMMVAVKDDTEDALLDVLSAVGKADLMETENSISKYNCSLRNRLLSTYCRKLQQDCSSFHSLYNRSY